MSDEINFRFTDYELDTYDLVRLLKIAQLYKLNCDNPTREKILTRIKNYQGIPASKAEKFSWTSNSKFISLPADILRLLGFYLNICEIIRLCRLNIMIHNNLYRNHQFLQTLGLQRLTNYINRLPSIDKILNEIHLSDTLPISNCKKGYEKPLIKHLVTQKYSILQSSSLYLLYSTAESGHLDIMQHLCENLVYNYKNLNIALIMAIEYNWLNIVDYLVSQGIDVSVDDHVALRTAIALGRLDIVKHLFGSSGNPKQPGILKNFDVKLFLSTSMVLVTDPKMIEYLQSMQ